MIILALIGGALKGDRNMDIIYLNGISENSNELIDIRISYLSEDYGGLSSEQQTIIKKSLVSYYERHLGKDLFVYTARTDHIISCCFLLVTEKPANPSFPNGRTGTVLNVYTEPNYRRMGIASKLMRMLIEDARSMGLDFVELKATESGYSVYRKLGFEDTESKYHAMRVNF